MFPSYDHFLIKWYIPVPSFSHNNHYMAVCQNLVPLVNIKIAGKWMFIPLKMVCIGIDQIHTHIWSFPFDPWFTHFFCLLRFDLLQPQVRRSKVTLEELEAGWMGWRSTATLVYYDILYVACIYIYTLYIWYEYMYVYGNMYNSVNSA